MQAKDLKVGDVVRTSSNGTARVTKIGYWSRTAIIIELDGVPDGWVKRDEPVEVVQGVP